METQLQARSMRAQRSCSLVRGRPQLPCGPRRCRLNVRAVLSPQRPVGDDASSHEQEALARARRAIDAVFLGALNGLYGYSTDVRSPLGPPVERAQRGGGNRNGGGVRCSVNAGALHRRSAVRRTAGMCLNTLMHT